MPRAFGFDEYGGPEMADVRDMPMPEAGPSELLVQVRAAGVNPVDWKIRSGALRDVMPVELPAVMGSEAAGVVRAVGTDVEGFAVGDEVFGNTAPGHGAFAEYTVLTAASSAAKPPDVSFTDAATLPVAARTAYVAVRQLDLEPGQTLLVVGIGGGVGVAAAQIARDRGITVVGTASEDKRELVESLGATLITYGPGVADRVRQILPDGVDAVFDLVGGDALAEVASLGSDNHRILSAADPQTAARFGGGPVQRDGSGTVLAEVAQLVADGKLDPHVEDVRPLDEAAAAVHAVETGHSRGKVVIEVR